MKLQICAQLMATTCFCYCHLTRFLYNYILPLSPRNKKKRQTISVYALTKGKAQDVSFHGGNSTFSNSFDKTKFLVSVYRWTHRYIDTYSMEFIWIVGVAIGFAPWIHIILLQYVNRELKHATFFSHGRTPQVYCFPILPVLTLPHLYF